MLGAYRDRGYIDMSQEYIAIMLNNESFQVANNNCALRGFNNLERFSPNMVFSAVVFPRRDFEKHVVLQDVHVGGPSDLGRNSLWEKAWDCDGEAAS